MQKYQNVAQDGLGNVIQGMNASVFLKGTQTPASLFADAGGTVPITNPQVTDALGNFAFYAANGRYDVQLARAGLPTTITTDILLFDPFGGGGGGPFNTGQVLFGSGGGIGQDPGLFWDNTNKRLGIGTAIPGVALHVAGAIQSTGNIVAGANLQVIGNSAIFGDTATDSASKILVRGTVTAVRIGAGGAGGGGVDGVDNTGSLSYQPLNLNGSQVLIGIAGTPKLTIIPGGTVRVNTPNGGGGAESLQIGTSNTTQYTQRIYGDVTANMSPVISMFRSGSKEAFIAVSNSGGDMLFGVTNGLANYNDASLNIGANLRISGTNGTLAVAAGVVTHSIDTGDTAPLVLSLNAGVVAHRFETNINAVNFLTSIPEPTGAAPILTSHRSSDANAGLGLMSKGAGAISFSTAGDTTPVKQFSVTHAVSAVNSYQVFGGATGANPGLYASGSDTNVGSNYSTQGTGAHNFFTGAGARLQFQIVDVASPANNFSVSGQPTGSPPSLTVVGSDTNIGTRFISKGTGSHLFSTNLGGPAVDQVAILHTATANRQLSLTGSSGNDPTISTVGGGRVNVGGVDFAVGGGQLVVTVGNGNVLTAGNITLLSGTSVPAGGNNTQGIRWSTTSNLGFFFGSGAPTLPAAKGSLYMRTDGTGTTDRMFINTNGSTTWTAITTVA